MKLSFIIFYCILFCTCSLTANAQTFKWVHRTADNLSSGVVVIDHQHNIISAGLYIDTIYFGADTFRAVNDNQNSCIAKYDSSGNVIWATDISVTGSYNYVDVTAISTDEDNNIYICGNIIGNAIHFTSADSLVFSSTYNSFVAKYDATGHFIHASPIYGMVNCRTLATDSAGNTIVGGMYIDTANFSGLTTHHDAIFLNVFLVKYNSSGSPIWLKTGRSLSVTSTLGGLLRVTTDKSGNIYCIGYMPGDFTYENDTIYNTINSSQVFVAKIDSTGNLLWYTMEGKYYGNNKGYAIAVDKKGNVYAGGNLNDSISASSNGFFAKYNSSGVRRWLKQYYRCNATIANIVVDANDDPYLSGTYFNRIAFDTTILVSSVNTSFIVKMDTAGNVIKAQTIKGEASIYGASIDDKNNNIALCGLKRGLDTFGTVIFPDTPYISRFIAYMSNPLSLSVAPVVIPLLHTTIYPNPATNVLYVKDAAPNTTLSIYNINGQRVYSAKLNSTIQAINIQELIKGIYLIKVVSPDGMTQTKTFVKE